MSMGSESAVRATSASGTMLVERRVILAVPPSAAWKAMASEWHHLGIECTFWPASATLDDLLVAVARMPSVLVVDLTADQVRGMTLVTGCRREADAIPVIVVAANPSIELARRLRLTGAFYLALDPVSPEEMRAVLSNAFECLARKATSPYGTRRRILIVDDDADFVTSTASLLESQGYDVVVARSGQEGLDAIRREAPDLVILDVMMESDATGYGVTQALKFGEGFECVRHVPILMVSSIGVEPSTRFRMAGEVEMVTPDGYLTKPLDIPTFLREIATLVGERRTPGATREG